MTKVHSFFHLLNSSMFMLILLLAILSVPVLYIKNLNPQYTHYFNIIAFFGISTLIFFSCYWVTYKQIHGGGFVNFLNYVGMFFSFFTIAMGFSLHNSLAVIEGHLGKKSAFVRTPKFNLNGLGQTIKTNNYLNRKIPFVSLLEALLCLYFGFAIYSAFQLKDYGLVLFHLMLFLGFGFVAYKSLLRRT